MLEDLTGSTEVTIFTKAYGAARDLLVQDRIIIVRGRVDGRGSGEVKLVGDEVLPFEAVAEVGVVRVSIDARTAAGSAIDELKELVREFPGDHPVIVELLTSRGPKRLRLGASFRAMLSTKPTAAGTPYT